MSGEFAEDYSGNVTLTDAVVTGAELNSIADKTTGNVTVGGSLTITAERNVTFATLAEYNEFNSNFKTRVTLGSFTFQDQAQLQLTTGRNLITYPRNVPIAEFISELKIDNAAVQFRIWDYRRGEEHPWVSYDQTEYSEETNDGVRAIKRDMQEAKIPIIYRYRGYLLEIRGDINPISVHFPVNIPVPEE